MDLQNFKANELTELNSIVGGTDIFGEDSGFSPEDEILPASGFIGEEDDGI